MMALLQNLILQPLRQSLEENQYGSYLRCFAIAILLAGAVLVPFNAAGEEIDDRPQPKIVKLGWDGRGPQNLLDNLERAKSIPFHGHTFKLPIRPMNIFWTDKTPDEAFEPHFAAMRELMTKDRGHVQHNLVKVWCTGTKDWDWFNDAHWDAALYNFRKLVELAALGDCDLMFDPESYPALEDFEGHGFWVFTYQEQPKADQYTYEQYAELMHRRGAEFMKVLQEAGPDVEILSMYGLGFHADLLSIPSRAEMFEKIKERGYYNLLPHFIGGMLSVADDDFRFYDGNELAYYYTTSEEFYRKRHLVLSRAHRLLRPELKQEFQQHYKMAHAVYAADIYPFNADDTDQFRAFFVQEMTRPQHQQFLAHNIFYGLKTTDKYVWYYTDHPIWNELSGDVPEGSYEAIEMAYDYLDTGNWFPREIQQVVADARDRYLEKAMGRAVRRTYTAVVAADKPTIDGRLNDVVWRDIADTEPFIQSVKNTDDGLEIQRSTVAAIAYDGDFLYVNVRSETSGKAALETVGTKRDDDVWRGDDLELLVGDPNNPSRMYLLMVNAEGVRYDAMLTVSGDATDSELVFDLDNYQPDWSVAMSFDEANTWVIEMAIPWDVIGGKPRSDQDLKLNIARGYMNHDGIAQTAFSQNTEGLLTPGQIGVVKLGF